MLQCSNGDCLYRQGRADKGASDRVTWRRMTRIVKGGRQVRWEAQALALAAREICRPARFLKPGGRGESLLPFRNIDAPCTTAVVPARKPGAQRFFSGARM